MAAELSKALQVNDMPEGLSIEPLPNFCFAGSISKVRRLSDGKVLDVIMSCYDKDVEGEEIVADDDGQYVSLWPGDYKIHSRLSWIPIVDKLVNRRVWE